MLGVEHVAFLEDRVAIVTSGSTFNLSLTQEKNLLASGESILVGKTKFRSLLFQPLDLIRLPLEQIIDLVKDYEDNGSPTALWAQEFRKFQKIVQAREARLHPVSLSDFQECIFVYRDIVRYESWLEGYKNLNLHFVDAEFAELQKANLEIRKAIREHLKNLSREEFEGRVSKLESNGMRHLFKTEIQIEKDQFGVLIKAEYASLCQACEG